MAAKAEKLQIPSDLNRVEEVETFLRKLFGQLNNELYNKMQLAVNEAVTNAIIHGNNNDRSKKVQISVKKQDDKIEINVKDEGTGFNPKIIPNPTDQEHLLKTSGRGIFLIK
ncbi:MAG TPA: ATP-binding protein, partial [Balneolaceae bacterium]|nr:ATP-binding protein [Balneolaceae bacterium]